MGPPVQLPPALRSRKWRARVTSENLVHMPSSAEHHIQNTAPGPPMAMAPATPAMLPVPTVAASAVHTAWKGVMAPSAASRLRNIRPRVVRMA